ncbi:MAG: PAS domain-containing sensor histidine kinase [Bacteroidota bacterium]
MSHKEKISSSNKTVYFLILSAGLFVALAILYGLFVGLRINFLYTTLFDASLEIKNNLFKARIEFLKNLDNPSQAAINQARTYLDIAEFNTHIILEEKERMNIVSLPLNAASLSLEVQKLQVLLLGYRELSSKISPKNSTNALKLRSEWETLYSNLEEQSNNVERELQVILGTYVKIFRINQFALITASLMLCIISIIVFYRSQKQKAVLLRKIEDTSINIEKKTRRTTKVEEALQESQRKLNTLIQNLPGMVYRCKVGQVWELDYVSDRCLHVTGYKAEDLINNKTVSYYDLINPEDKKKILEQIQQAVEEKKRYQLVYRIKTAGGYEKWIWEEGVEIFSEKDDELIALEGFITDITEQKTVEDQLSLQGAALEAAANGIVITDKEGNLLWANSAFAKMTGYSVKEMIGTKLNALKSGMHNDSYYAYMWSKINSGELWRGEIINKRKDGSLYTEEMTITPIKNTAGEIIYFVAIKQDITERKKAEEALGESELRFRGLYENATIGIYRTTPDGQILMANPTLLKIAGYESLDEIAKIGASNMYADATTRDIFQHELEERGKIFGFESKWKKKDGTIIYTRESARAVKDDDGNILYYEGTIEDISDKKKIEEDLIEAKDRAEQSDRLKSEFLAQMSHEIRTPLNVILSFTGMMKDELQDKVDDELADGFNVIETEGKRIMRTVELILNMSELQTGSYSYRPKRIDIFKDVIQKLHHNLQIIANQKKISFELHNNNTETMIEGDEYSINQIFLHLIENAIKYTLKGKVEITINRDPRNNLYVDVADTGIGIADEYMPLLFTPFTREEKGYTRNFEGNGLGLALVKKYCELNGADIKVTSTKGKGTTFRVTFPNSN